MCMCWIWSTRQLREVKDKRQKQGFFLTISLSGAGLFFRVVVFRNDVECHHELPFKLSIFKFRTAQSYRGQCPTLTLLETNHHGLTFL